MLGGINAYILSRSLSAAMDGLGPVQSCKFVFMDSILAAVGYRSIDQTCRSLAASPNDLRLVAVTRTSGS